MQWFSEPIPAVLLAGNRTGGTFLTTALSSHQEIFCARGEPFHHENAWRKVIPDDKARLRLLWQQRGYAVSMFKMNLSDLNNPQRQLLEENTSLKIIFLTRDDIATQALSNEINVVFRDGKISGQPTQAISEEEIFTSKVKIDPQAVVNRCHRIMQNNQNVHRWLKTLDQPYLHLTYEQLTQGREIICIPNEVSRDTCDFLEVTPKLLCGVLRKIHKRPMEDYVLNWDEIYNRLHGDLRLL